MSEWTLIIDNTDDVFDALRHNHQLKMGAEIRELALIAQASDEYQVDETRADAAAEKLIQGGADGTATIGDFLAIEIAGLLQISPTTAALRISETLNLRDRHPELWAFVHAGTVRPWQALKIAARCVTAGLSGDAAKWVDHQLAISVTTLGWTRALRTLEGLIVSADTELAAERARIRREQRQVYVGDHAYGGSILFARLDTEDALALDQTISDLSNALAAAGSTEPVDQRRATALGILADPRAALDLLTGAGNGTPTNRTATLVVHIAAEPNCAHRDPRALLGQASGLRGTGAGTGASVTSTDQRSVIANDLTAFAPRFTARIEGVGPLDGETLRRFLGHSRVTVRPVVDLNTAPAVDAYEIPARLREHVQARNPVEAFPFSARRSPGLDLDHTDPYQTSAPPGTLQTRAENLGPLSRRVHRAKTARAWNVVQTEPGTFVWTSRHGFRYEVSPHGTLALGRIKQRQAA